MGMNEARQARRPVILVVMVKCLLAAYLVTGGGLLLLALLLYRLGLSESAVNIGIIIIYALAGFKDVGNHFFTTLMICAGSGMLGGMVS